MSYKTTGLSGACCAPCASHQSGLGAASAWTPSSGTVITAKIVGTGLSVATGYGVGRLVGSPRLGYALMGASLLYSLFMWNTVTTQIPTTKKP